MITSDGVRLHVETHGVGRPLVLVHGWTMSCRFFDRQVKELSNRFKVVTYDLRGHGRSETSRRGHTVERYALDLRELIESLDLRGCILCGWSLAVPVVLEYWNHFEDDRIDALGLIEATPAPMHPAEWNTHGLSGRDAMALDIFLNAFVANRSGYGRSFVNGMFAAGAAGSDFDWMFAEYLLARPSSAAAIYREYARCDYVDALRRVTVPSLAAFGSHAKACFGPKTGRFTAESMPDCRLEIFNQSGHMPFWEEADAFNRSIDCLAARIPAKPLS